MKWSPYDAEIFAVATRVKQLTGLKRVLYLMRWARAWGAPGVKKQRWNRERSVTVFGISTDEPTDAEPG
jgi:hypothetical protein